MIIETIKKYIPVITLIVSLGLLISSRSCKSTEEIIQKIEDKQKAVSSITLEVKEKDSPEAPDLIIKQIYTADINGEKITVPVKPVDKPSGSLHSPEGTTAKVTQEVDLTPIVKKLQPNWEVGIGAGYHKEVYIPVSVQRNYKPKRAIAVELHLDPSDKKISGTEVMHKWFF